MSYISNNSVREYSNLHTRVLISYPQCSQTIFLVHKHFEGFRDHSLEYLKNSCYIFMVLNSQMITLEFLYFGMNMPLYRVILINRISNKL